MITAVKTQLGFDPENFNVIYTVGMSCRAPAPLPISDLVEAWEKPANTWFDYFLQPGRLSALFREARSNHGRFLCLIRRLFLLPLPLHFFFFNFFFYNWISRSSVWRDATVRGPDNGSRTRRCGCREAACSTSSRVFRSRTEFVFLYILGLYVVSVFWEVFVLTEL